MIKSMTSLLAACTVALALAPNAADAASIKVAIVSRTVFFMPLWIAQERGFFKDEGLEVTAEILNNAEKINEELKSGVAQIAISSPEALVANAYKGGTLRVVASVAQKPPHFIITKPSIKSVEQLKGAKFGVLSMHEGTTYLVEDMAKAIGLKPGEYEIAAVGGAPTRQKLLAEGKIDAGLQPFPLSYEADAAGFTNLGPIAKYVPDYEFTTVFVENAWAQANKQALIGFLRAMRRGQAFMKTHPAETVAIAVKELRTTPAFAERALTDVARVEIMPEGLAVSEKGMARIFATMQSHGFIPAAARFDMTKFVDPSYLAAAR